MWQHWKCCSNIALHVLVLRVDEDYLVSETCMPMVEYHEEVVSDEVVLLDSGQLAEPQLSESLPHEAWVNKTFQSKNTRSSFQTRAKTGMEF